MTEHRHWCPICIIFGSLVWITILGVCFSNYEKWKSPGFIVSFESCREVCAPPNQNCLYVRNVTLQWTRTTATENRTYTASNFTGALFGCQHCCYDQVGVLGSVVADPAAPSVPLRFLLYDGEKVDFILSIVVFSLALCGACCCIWFSVAAKVT